MPLHIVKKGNKYCVTDPAGKQFGCHPSRKEAVDQIAAIEISKHKRGASMSDENKSGAEHLIAKRVRVLAQDLNRSFGLDATNAPPIAIISDGTSDGTVVLVHGQVVSFNHMDFNCYKGDYPSCGMSITTREKDANGVEVSRSITLRKYDEIKAALAQLTNQDKTKE